MVVSLQKAYTFTAFAQAYTCVLLYSCFNTAYDAVKPVLNAPVK